MDLFPDGQHVRLRSSGRGLMYLHADEDGVGVRLSQKRASLRSAWKVHHAVSAEGVVHVLLHGAAYGRYLTSSRDPAPHGHKGRALFQGEYKNFNSVAWRPERVGAEDGGDKVILWHSSHHVLRANGMVLPWNKGVTLDHPNDRSSMRRWVVEAIPPRQFPPELPLPVPEPHRGWFWTKMHVGTVVPGVPGTTIRFVRANGDGEVPNNWQQIQFQGRSVFNLRSAVAAELQEVNANAIKLCVRAGNLARLTPLAIDLPRKERAMDIIALTAGSPAAEALLHPDVDAP